MPSAPCSQARLNAASVFSGASCEAPRWATMIWASAADPLKAERRIKLAAPAWNLMDYSHYALVIDLLPLIGSIIHGEVCGRQGKTSWASCWTGTRWGFTMRKSPAYRDLEKIAEHTAQR